MATIAAPLLLEELTPYADFYYTQQLLEAARNRIFNTVRTTDKMRIPPESVQEILLLTTQLYDRMFNRGKEVICELRKHLLARVASQDKDANAIKLSRQWSHELNVFNRRTMQVVYTLSESVIQHEKRRDSDANPTPIANIDAKNDCSVFIQHLRETWEAVRG